MNKKNDINYTDYLYKLYGMDTKLEKNEFLTRNITFQVTDDCPMSCSYCYQINKGHKKMSFDVAKRAIDLIFEMYDKNDNPFINHKTKALIFDFIGGEPLMAIDVIDYICTYFVDKCIELNHPWLYTWRGSMTSNGALYFQDDVQNFLKKFNGFISLSITLDGDKEIHDSCRVYHDGKGNFDDAYAAMKHFNSHFHEELGTKVTIAPENLPNLNRIVDFFVNEGMKLIHANCVYEANWNIDNAKLFYSELKKMADKLLFLNDETTVSLFNEKLFDPLDKHDDNNWCGGTGKMLAFDPDGIAYPCLRYMPSSLGKDIKPITIGSVYNGIFATKEDKNIKDYLDSITRHSQSTDECFNCTIARGCSWCSAWNYQLLGSPNKRCTNICIMHKARSLANVYYWNKYYKLNNIDKVFKMYLSKDDAIKIIGEEEYMLLNNLSNK